MNALHETKQQSSLLVIDDDESVRELLQTVLIDAGYIVNAAETGREGMRLAMETASDVII